MCSVHVKWDMCIHLLSKAVWILCTGFGFHLSPVVMEKTNGKSLELVLFIDWILYLSRNDQSFILNEFGLSVYLLIRQPLINLE